MLKLILAGVFLTEVLTIIARLVESRGDGIFRTIWLPADTGNQLYCVAAPRLPGLMTKARAMRIGHKGGSCGTVAYRKEPVFTIEFLTDPVWDVYRDRILPFGIRAVRSQSLFNTRGSRSLELARLSKCQVLMDLSDSCHRHGVSTSTLASVSVATCAPKEPEIT
jgi:formate hydrogenlyase transcriptional activator